MRGAEAGIPAASTASTARAATALVATLALVAAARAGLAWASGTWGWSLAVQRDLDPPLAWALWSLPVIALLPPVGRAVAPGVERWALWAEQRTPALFAAGALLAAALVMALPDRVRFVGDALLRLRTLQVQGLIPTAWYPQALPLDLAIHHRLAGALMRALHSDAALPGRLIGAVDAAMFAVCALALPRVLGLRGAAAFAASATAFWGGALTLFTGYNKAFAEMALAVAATGVLGIRVARTGRGQWPLGLVVAAALLAHRSALALVPAYVVAVALAPRSSRARFAWLATLPVTAALAYALPRIYSIATRIDPMHFAPRTLDQPGFFAGFVGGARPADLANLLVFLAPLAALVPVLALARAPRRDPRAGRVLMVLAAPFLAIMPFIHPGQGLFRDWDDFAATGVSVALLAAWQTGEALRDSPRAAALAAAVALACAAPTTQWLLHHADAERGLARVRRFVTEPPERIRFERAVTWQFLGQAESDRGRYAPAADAYAAAATLLPSPNVSRQWGMAELRAGRFDRARGVFRAMVARDSADVIGWTGLALASDRLDDAAGAQQAADRAAALDPEGRVLRAMSSVLGTEAKR